MKRKVMWGAMYLYLAVAAWAIGAHFTNDVLAQTATQNNLLITVQQLDASGTPILNRSIGYLVYNGTAGGLTSGSVSDTMTHSLTLPVSPALQFYFRNTSSTQKVTITWTPQGGSSATITVLQPGSAIAFWNTSTSTTAGATAISYAASASGATFEYFLGG